MIKQFVEEWEKKKGDIQEHLRTMPPRSYEELVKAVIEILSSDHASNFPDPERVHTIDDGDYQGTLVFVIGEKGYQPSTYWYVKISYGSCSGCDTLEAIKTYDDEPLNEEALSDYMTLALHVVQGLKLMGDDYPVA